MDISCKDFQPGLTYVAVSRVRSLQGIMFDRQFDMDSLRSNAFATNYQRERGGQTTQGTAARSVTPFSMIENSAFRYETVYSVIDTVINYTT